MILLERRSNWKRNT